MNMPNPLFVGVDIALKSQRVCLLDSEGAQQGRRFTVANSRSGTHNLAEQLARVLREGGYDSVRLAAEATGWYWFHLFQCLGSEPALQPWPLQLYALNPRLPAKYKETFSDLDKSDDTDAFVIADRLRIGRDLPQPYQLQPVHLALRFLTRYRYHLVQDLVREKNYCTNLIYLKTSQYRPEHPFADIYGATSQAVLRQFVSCEEIVATPLAELVALLDAKSKGRLADSEQTAHELQAVAQASYVLPEGLQASVHLVLGCGLEHLRFLERQVQRLDMAIADQLLALPNTLQTIPGIGPVYAAGIVAELGDLARYHYQEAKVAKAAGLKWSKHQSGEFEAQDTHLSRAGNHYLRYYFCEAANAVRMHDAEYQAYYERKYQEVRKHQHKRAVTLTARKLVRLVVRLLTTNQPYRPRRPASP
jgi:transposase